ncbi:MAG TPA: threonine synthase [Candidatus Eisenbacteria bacterium]|jgi:threonine synthase|nr:threonine synthase [Candidatus Eisenbacteria bacterium]
MREIYQLRCRECGKLWGNAPRSFCEECFSPLEVAFDYEALKSVASKEKLIRRDFNMWRYAEFLPLPEGFSFPNAVGGTPLVASKHLAKKWGLRNLYFKNDAVCFPSLSFKDRVVATALAAAGRFGFKTVGCSSTGNLANAVAAQSAQQGFDACVFIPADLEPAKILNTAVYGARIVRINGNYDHVNRLCAQIADRFQWGLVNVNLRSYYAEGSKTHGFEIAEQLGWRLPDNVVVPMAGGSLITKIAKAFRELVTLGWVEEKPVKFFGAQATGCSPISTAVKRGLARFEPQKPDTIARSLAIGNPADGPFAIKLIRESGGWADDTSDREVVEAIQLLAETEGIFAETAGGVTAGVTQKLIREGRISSDETTVVCITGNGLKTTDAIVAEYPATEAIAPKLEAFEAYLDSQLAAGAAVAGKL